MGHMPLGYALGLQAHGLPTDQIIELLRKHEGEEKKTYVYDNRVDEE
jgi:hypothetical protein